MSVVRKPTKGQALIVLGTHCSGASTLTGLLAVSGVITPGQRSRVGDENATEASQTTALVRFDDSMLRQFGLSWNSWAPMPARDLRDKVAAPMMGQACGIVQDQFGDADMIVLDDPTMCRLVPFWSDALLSLERTPFYMLVLRDPSEVAQSLRAGNGLDMAHGLLLWMTYVLEAEASTRGKRRRFTTYDAICDEPLKVLAQVHDLLDRPIPSTLEHKREQIEAYATSENRHHDVTRLDALPQVYGAVYEVLTRWAQFGEDPADHAVLDLGLQQFQSVSSRTGDAISLYGALGQEQDGKPAQLDEFSRLKLTISEQRRQLAQKDDALAIRDKELAALGQLFVKARATSADLLQSTQASEIREKDHIAEIQSLTTDRDTRQHELDHFAQENSELHALVAKVENKRAALQSENTELHALVAKVESKRAALQGENTELHALVAKVEAAQEGLENQNTELHSLVAKVEAARADLQSENTELHALVAKVEGERAKLESRNTELDASVSEVEAARAGVQSENAELHALVARIKKERAALISSRSWRLTRPVRRMGRFFRSGSTEH
jgi:hypothetical protein